MDGIIYSQNSFNCIKNAFKGVRFCKTLCCRIAVLSCGAVVIQVPGKNVFCLQNIDGVTESIEPLQVVFIVSKTC